MVRELVITIYLFVFKLIFNVFNKLPSRDKLVFVVTFSQNSLFIYKELKRQNVPSEVVFLCKPSSYSYIKREVRQALVLPFETVSVFNMVRCIYHLATSKTVIVDNYYGFLASVSFKQDVQCIQVWHAVGAIKAFGLRDASTTNRSEKAKKRFRSVYSKFDKIVIGSEALGHIFIKAFGVTSDRFLRIGVPRTDLFFDKDLQKYVCHKLFEQNKVLEQRKVILYAPTYRDNKLYDAEVMLDLGLMRDKLGEEYVIIIKMHPAIKKRYDYESLYPGFVFDYSSYPDVNHLLLVTDVLITDYSSIPHEFSLLSRPMIFYPYDLDVYKKQRGLWEDYHKMVPGPIAYTTEEIICFIQENKFDLGKVKNFAIKWNEYSRGNSSANLVNHLYGDKGARERGVYE